MEKKTRKKQVEKKQLQVRVARTELAISAIKMNLGDGEGRSRRREIAHREARGKDAGERKYWISSARTAMVKGEYAQAVRVCTEVRNRVFPHLNNNMLLAHISRLFIPEQGLGSGDNANRALLLHARSLAHLRLGEIRPSLCDARAAVKLRPTDPKVNSVSDPRGANLAHLSPCPATC